MPLSRPRMMLSSMNKPGEFIAVVYPHWPSHHDQKIHGQVGWKLLVMVKHCAGNVDQFHPSYFSLESLSPRAILRSIH